MKNAFTFICTAILLGGCALPVPVQVASWALDGLSYLATQKTVTDHGISIVAQKDCALLRGITEGELCREWDDLGTLVADADVKEQKSFGTSFFAPKQHAPAGIVPISSETPKQPLSVNPDRGNPSARKEERLATLPSYSSQQEMIMPELESAVNFVKKEAWKHLTSNPKDAQSLPVTAAVDLPNVPVKKLKLQQLTSIKSKEPASGVYWVIGSFRNYGAALSLVENYDQLMPEILAAKLGVKSVYRVVVGPVPEGEERAIHRSVSKAGLRDLWAIRIKAGEWSLARKLKDRNSDSPSVSGEELARLPQ